MFTLDRFIAAVAALHLHRVESGIRSIPTASAEMDLRFPQTSSVCLQAIPKPHPLIYTNRHASLFIMLGNTALTLS